MVTERGEVTCELGIARDFVLLVSVRPVLRLAMKGWFWFDLNSTNVLIFSERSCFGVSKSGCVILDVIGATRRTDSGIFRSILPTRLSLVGDTLGVIGSSFVGR